MSMFAATICSSVIVARDLPGELRTPRQHALDDAPPPGLQRSKGDPIADRRELAARRRPVPQPAGHAGQQVRMPGMHRVDMLMLERDASGHGALLREGRKRGRKCLVPAEGGKIHVTRVAQRVNPPGSARRHPDVVKNDALRAGARGYRHFSVRSTMARRSFVAALLFLAVASAAQAQTWTIDSAHSAAHFAVRHMMVSTVRGDLGKITGTVTFDPAKPAAGTIEATIDVTGIDTREPGRDTHLKSADFFDVAKFPTATFKSKTIEPAAGGGFKVTGDLTMHGVTKDVVLDVEAAPAGHQGPARRVPHRHDGHRRSSTGRTSA